MKDKERPKASGTKVVTIKKGSVISSQLEPRPSARDRLEAVIEAERFRLTSLAISLALIIVFSAIILVICCILISSFKLPLLTMASENFRAAPVIMVIASCLSIGFSLLCILLLSEKRQKLLFWFGLAGILVFLFQLIGVILAFVLRNNIETDFNKINVDKELRQAVADNSTMEIWDTLQTRYKCCGGRGNSGYREWENHLPTAYPDSCCTVKYPDCGRQARKTLESDFSQTIYERLHVRGCVTAIKESLHTYVLPMLLAWALLGILVALCQLLLILLCFLFLRHLKRRKSGPVRRTRLTSTGKLEREPLHYTSTLNVNIK